jgi:hypothetical protein
MERTVGTTFAMVRIEASLRRHVQVLTEVIGERSVARPENLSRSADYIGSVYEEMGLRPILEPYAYKRHTVANVIAEVSPSMRPARRYLLGAHYDSLAGTVGADDNASSVAVQLETARILNALKGTIQLEASVRFVSFALEERPTFWSPYRGSWVHARRARETGEPIDGMLCLEMVGYRSSVPGSQHYPFPLMHLDYPETGDFVGIIGDGKSAPLVRAIRSAFLMNRDLPSQTLIVPLKGWLTPFVRRSDHVSFWDLGYPAVMLTDTAEFRNPHYHKRTDTLDKLDYGFMAELVESLVLFFSGTTPLSVTGRNRP